MTTSLRSRLGELAASFATSVLDAVRGASLDDLRSEAFGLRSRSGAAALGRASVAGEAGEAGPAPRRRRGRLPRRSASQIANVVERIVALLKQSPRGLRAEEIRDKLGLQSKELPRPLKEGLDDGRIAKSGQRRATTYFVKGSAPAKDATGKAATRASRRPSRKTSRRAKRKPSSKVAAKRLGARTRRPRKRAGRAAKRSRAAVRRGKRSSTSKARASGKRKKAAAAGSAKPAQPVAAPPVAPPPSP
jgi:hypothetical protein